MTSILDPRVATDAVISRLETDTGKLIGDAIAPAAGTLPYAVVTPLGDTDYSGPINDGQADIEMSWQVTSVGETREQAQWMQNKCRQSLLAQTLTVTGYSLMKVDLDGGAGVERDDDFKPPLFYAVDIYAVMLTPS